MFDKEKGKDNTKKTMENYNTKKQYNMYQAKINC